MIIMNRFILSAALILSILTVKSRQLFFSRYSLPEGLSQSVVNCIFQDSKGFMWVGTQNGLNRFDGYSFRVYTYNPADSTSITNNWIYAVAEDKDGNLWIGTKGGLNKYYRDENRFARVRYNAPYPVDVTDCVYDVKCSRSGHILINTPPVLTLCDPASMTFLHYTSPLPYDGSVKDNNLPLLETNDGRIITGSTRGAAFFSLPDESWSVHAYDPDTPSGLSGNNITALFQDTRGIIWVGTSTGLNRLNDDGKSFTVYRHHPENSFTLSNDFIRAILEDKAGCIWIATEGGGLNLLSKVPGRDAVFENYSAGTGGLNHNITLSLAVDRSDNLWIGTLSGLNKTDLKKQKFRLYRNDDSPYSVELAGNVIASLFKDENGIIWAGNWGQGLNLLNRVSGTVIHYSSQEKGRLYLPNDFVHTIFEDSKKSIWIGTRDGLLVFDKPGQAFFRPSQYGTDTGMPDFRGLRIFRMIQGEDGDYWIATQNGLFRKPAGKNDVVHYHTMAEERYRISSNLVYSVMKDNKGLIWIGTTEGLDVLDPVTSKLRHYRRTEGNFNTLADNFVTVLCEDYNGDIWIGTSSYANRFSKKDSSFTYYTKEHGLPGNIIYSIVRDTGNRLWFATGNGLSRYDPAGDTFQSFTLDDGLQGPEFNLGASFVSSDGEIFLGGMNGFNSFYPDSVFLNPYQPEIIITSAYKMNRGLRHMLDPGKDHCIVLAHNDNALTIEFAALEFTQPLRNRFKYRFEGVDDEWIEIGNRNFVSFPKLRRGKYNLQIKGSNNDGV
jgi:ligand-binding sensor domain-containing protein